MTRILRWLAGAMALLAACPSLQAADADTFSPVVSFQYQDSLADPAAQTPILSPAVSYQYFDWPGDGNLTFTNSLNVSYQYNGPCSVITHPISQIVKAGQTVNLSVIVTGTPPLTYQWRLNGVPIENTDSPGIQIPDAQPLNSGVYSVIVNNTYLPAAVSRDANVVIYSSAPGLQPPSPTLIQSNQLPSINLTTAPAKATSAQLKLYNRITGLFEAVPAQSFLPRKVAVVLTHGWKSSLAAWPSQMAATLSSAYGNDIFIFGWDWQQQASNLNLVRVADRTPNQGEALGHALIDALGQSYSKPVHFMGHSLGTLVNCRAADYIHGDLPNKPTKANTAYLPENTHITLFDEAELAVPEQAQNVILGIENPPGNAAPGKVIPTRKAYTDNYISEVGLLQSSIENTMLWRRISFPLIFDFTQIGFHSYAQEWYRQSVLNPLSSLSGHRWSFERGTIGPLSQASTYWLQSMVPGSSPLTVSVLNENAAELISHNRIKAYAGLNTYRAIVFPSYEWYKGLSAVGRSVEGAYLSRIQIAGNAVADFVETFTPPSGPPVYLQTSGSTPAYYGGIAGANSDSSQAVWNLQFSISAGSTQPRNVRAPMRAALSSSSGSNVAYTILPYHVPPETVAVSFEYRTDGAARGEFVAVGIADNNLYTMETEYLEQGVWNASPLIDISQFQNQDIQLVFAYNGAGAAPVGTLSVRSVQFYVPPRPQLDLAASGNQLQATWPRSAVDWTLEASDDLSNPNGWKPVPGVPDELDYAHSIKMDITGEKKFFFRLRK